jgi:hypothetical protein
MPVVPAGVHSSGIERFVADIVFFAEPQGVDVRAQGHAGIFPAFAAVQVGDNSHGFSP